MTAFELAVIDALRGLREDLKESLAEVAEGLRLELAAIRRLEDARRAPENEPLLYSLRQVARMLRWGRSGKLAAAVRDGSLPVVYDGKRPRVRAEDLARFIAQLPTSIAPAKRGRGHRPPAARAPGADVAAQILAWEPPQRGRRR